MATTSPMPHFPARLMEVRWNLNCLNDDLTLLDVFVINSTLPPPRMAANRRHNAAAARCSSIKSRLSCAIKPAKVHGKSITTLEGLDDEHRQQIAETFRSMRWRAVWFLYSRVCDAGCGAM